MERKSYALLKNMALKWFSHKVVSIKNISNVQVASGGEDWDDSDPDMPRCTTEHKDFPWSTTIS